MAVVARTALEDEEIQPLRDNPAWTEKVTDLFEKLIPKREAG